MISLLLLLGCVHPAPGPVPEVWEVPLANASDGTVMYGYSWVDEGVLAVMPRPSASDLQNIAADGVDLLVTLTQSPLDPASIEAAGLDSIHLPVVDFQAPSDEQMFAFVTAVEERRAAGQRVGVHCLAGKGRAGTMAAVWFVHEGMGAEEAISHVRMLRPGSIESDAQEAAVHHYEQIQ